MDGRYRDAPDNDEELDTDGLEAMQPDAPLESSSSPDPMDIDDSQPTPRFMADDRSGRWKWIPYSVQKVTGAIFHWAQGPENPRDWKIEPIFPVVQHAPLWLLDKVTHARSHNIRRLLTNDRFLPNKKHRGLLLFVYLALWLITFVLVIRSGQNVTEIDGFGEPSTIGCGDTFWTSGNSCDLNGIGCRPFNDSGFAFRCPASCASYRLLNYRAVGAQEVIYQPLVIGGPPATGNDTTAIYRGDSFLCGAAIHAGVITDGVGGCGVVRVIGPYQNYSQSSSNGIDSIAFDSYFPKAFAFMETVECEAKDVQWSLLAVSTVFTTVLSLFTTSAWVFFFPIFTIVFWQVGMASDAPSYSAVADLFTDILGKYLPAMFCAWVFYDKMGVHRALAGLTAQFEKTILWLGGCWVGALTNYTFDFIPISRLDSHDLQQQPGAIAALVIIIIVLLVVVVSQVWFFRQEGRLIRYLKLYALFIGGIVVCLVLPDMNLRIHHYVLALLLLPGTSMQTRPSLLYQGILIGFFANGIARWGFDPILQTDAALQGDAPSNSPLPVILAPQIASDLSNITIRWEDPPSTIYDGISILVNDVERQRSFFDDYDDETFGGHPLNEFVWTRQPNFTMNEYFRFAFMEGSTTWDYTQAGTWTSDGEWVDMAPGPSKIKKRSADVERIVQRR